MRNARQVHYSSGTITWGASPSDWPMSSNFRVSRHCTFVATTVDANKRFGGGTASIRLRPSAGHCMTKTCTRTRESAL